MNSREQTLAYLLLGATVLIAGGALGYFLFFQPYQQLKAEEAKLKKEIEDLEGGLKAQQAVVAKMTEYKQRSLPADKNLAQKEYIYLLNDLLAGAGAPAGYGVQPKPVDNTARYVPEISKGRPVYTKIACEVTIKKADMWVVKDFLKGYYDLGLLQQITALSIKRDEDSSAKAAGRRDDLTVVLTTEALVIDGAENRRTLIPVPTAFAGAGGAALYKSMTMTPEAGRGVVPHPRTQVLAAAPRDYGLLVFRDPFNGPLKQPPPFKIDPIKDVKFVEDAAPPAVKIALTGEGAVGATVKVTESGRLFGSGLKVDYKTGAITIPKPSGAGTSTITVSARSVEGIETSTTFKVSVEKKPTPPTPPVPPPPPDLRPDVAASILLIGATPRSDGTAWARVKDNANRLRYNIEAGPTGVKVEKEWFVLEWKKDRDHDEPPGVMHISDDSVKTDRRLEVLAVTAYGLVVADKKPEPKKGARPAPPKPVAVAATAAAVLPSRVYFWAVGSSLAGLKPLSPETVAEVRARAKGGRVLDLDVEEFELEAARGVSLWKVQRAIRK